MAQGPALMREAVGEMISSQPDLVLMEMTPDEASIMDCVGRVKPDLLIIAVESTVRPARCGFLLGRYPNLRILALNCDSNIATHYWAQISLKSEELKASTKQLLSVVRGRSDSVVVQ